MPRVTVYIRNDDYKKWKSVDNKAELISMALNRGAIEIRPRFDVQTSKAKSVGSEILKPTYTPSERQTVPSKCKVCGSYACGGH